MPNYEHNIKHQTFEIIRKKYTTEPAKAHLNSVMETVRNHSIMKNRKIQNFQRNSGDLKNSKQNLKFNFTFSKDAIQQKEQVFVIYV